MLKNDRKLILENVVSFPPSMSTDAKDLISKLLRTNPKERLGVNVIYIFLKNRGMMN
jgi:serine/threonine protein kinase